MVGATPGANCEEYNDNMGIQAIRDLDEVRVMLSQGFWLQRVLPPTVETVRPALEWTQAIMVTGHALPPISFVADLGHILFNLDWQSRDRQRPGVPHVSPNLLAAYEDHVLGKLYADWTFSAAGEVLRRYRRPRDRARGVAFVVNRFCERASCDGLEFSPAILQTSLDRSPQELLQEGFDSLAREGLYPDLASLYDSLIAACRRMGESLDRDDLQALQQGIALDDEGEQIAYHQVLRAATLLEAGLPAQRIHAAARRQEVPTRVLDEDTYPVGGFASLSNRGSVESLLHSQLAYMEDGERPDLFDVKYLRDELLYYSRDENTFFRHRRTYIIALLDDLATCIRFKDAELPYQRGILLLALLVVVVRKLCDWLSADALQFEIVLALPPDRPRSLALQAEFELLLKLLREPVNNHTVIFHFVAGSAEDSKEIMSRLRERVPERSLLVTEGMLPAFLARLCADRARRSLCHCLVASTRDVVVETEDADVTQMRLDRAFPTISGSESAGASAEGAEALATWCSVLHALLQQWV